jgi:hypothetical protein
MATNLKVHLPQAHAPVQVVRVVVPDTGEPQSLWLKAPFQQDVELLTERVPCLALSKRKSVELCAVVFGNYDQLVVAPASVDDYAFSDVAPPKAWLNPVVWGWRPENMRLRVYTAHGVGELSLKGGSVVHHGPVRYVFEGRSVLYGCWVGWRCTGYAGLPFADVEVWMENSEVAVPRGHFDFRRLTFEVPQGAVLVSTCERQIDGFEPKDGSWDKGRGEVDLVRPVKPTQLDYTLHTGSEITFRFLLAQPHVAATDAVMEFRNRPGFAISDAGLVTVDGFHSLPLDSKFPMVVGARAAAANALTAVVVERQLGVRHSGSYPGGPSVEAREGLRHPMGQRDAAPTGALAADPRAFVMHATSLHPETVRGLLAFEDGLFDRWRGTLKRAGDPYVPQGLEKFTLQRSPPGEPFATKGVDPEGWWEAQLMNPGALPPDFGMFDDQHFACQYTATGTVAQLTNSRHARRRLKDMAQAAMAHTLKPWALSRGPKLGSFAGRGLGWTGCAVVLYYALTGDVSAREWLKDAVDMLVSSQTPLGNFRVDDFSKEFAGPDSTYARDILAKRLGRKVSEVPGLAGTQPYQESIVIEFLEQCVQVGIPVPLDTLDRAAGFVWGVSLAEGASAPWYRIVFNFDISQFSKLSDTTQPLLPLPLIVPGSSNTSDYNAQHVLAHVYRRNPTQGNVYLNRWLLGGNQLNWLVTSNPTKAGNREALISALSGHTPKASQA